MVKETEKLFKHDQELEKELIKNRLKSEFVQKTKSKKKVTEMQATEIILDPAI